MTGMSIGELFIKLGFDVDDKTLKSFNSNIAETASGLLKLAGISASVAGFTSLLNGAANTATQIKNLNTELGINQRYASGFAAAFHEANPLRSYVDGLQTVANISKYIADMQVGKGGQQLGFFGGGAQDDTPEKVITRLRTGYASALAYANGNKALVAEWVQQITGTADTINVVTESLEDFQRAAAKGVVTDKQILQLDRYNKAVADLGNSFDQLKAKWLATPAEEISHFLNDATDGKLMPGIKKDTASEYQKKKSNFLDFITSPSKWGSAFHFEVTNTGSQSPAQRKSAARSPLGLSLHNPGNLQPHGIEASYPDDDAGLLAMANNLRKYGARGWNTLNAIVEHWAPGSGAGNSPETEAAYKAALQRLTGFSGNQSLNLNDPETLHRIMGPMIRQEQGTNPFSEQQLTRAANRSVSVNANISITSTDPEEAGHQVENHLQRVIDNAHSQLDNGASW